MRTKLLDKTTIFIREINLAKDIETLDRIVTAHFKDVGVDMVSYRQLSTAGAIDSNVKNITSFYGFPPWWVSFYKASQFCAYDPVLIKTVENNNPISWEKLIESIDKTDEIKKYIAEVEKLGMQFGVAFPVYGPYLRGGIFFLGFVTSSTELTETELSLLHWSCQAAHSNYAALATKNLKEDIHLTQRESQVLRWMALGKSNAEIGTILDISQHTISTYVRRIYLKLDVYDRVTASLRAISLGLV